MGYHLGSRCFVRSWKKRKKLVQSFKKDPKRPLISLCQNARFLISCELFVVFEYVNLCVCFFLVLLPKLDALLEPPRWSINTFKEENSMGLFLDGHII